MACRWSFSGIGMPLYFFNQLIPCVGVALAELEQGLYNIHEVVQLIPCI